MEPFLLPKELERRAERRAIRIIIVIFSAICYALLWKWGYLRWSPGSVAFVIVIPLLLSFFAMTKNPVELTVVCLMIVGLIALALPTFRHVQEKERQIEELQKQRRLRLKELRLPDASHPMITAAISPRR